MGRNSKDAEVILSEDWAAIKALLAKAPLLHIRRFAIFCARDALATTRCSDLRLHMAVLTLQRYIEGEATAEEIAKAKQTAYAAVYAAADATTVYAAGAAVHAADAAAARAARAADAAGYAAAYATAGYAAGAAGYAAGAAAARAARAAAAYAARQRQADAWEQIKRGRVAA